MTPRKSKHPSPPAAADGGPSFEALLERLQAIVAELEKGEQPLERSVALFEEGVALTRAGMARLDAAEQRVAVLVETDGEEREEEFASDDSDESDEA